MGDRTLVLGRSPLRNRSSGDGSIMVSPKDRPVTADQASTSTYLHAARRFRDREPVLGQPFEMQLDGLANQTTDLLPPTRLSPRIPASLGRRPPGSNRRLRPRSRIASPSPPRCSVARFGACWWPSLRGPPSAVAAWASNTRPALQTVGFGRCRPVTDNSSLSCPNKSRSAQLDRLLDHLGFKGDLEELFQVVGIRSRAVRVLSVAPSRPLGWRPSRCCSAPFALLTASRRIASLRPRSAHHGRKACSLRNRASPYRWRESRRPSYLHSVRGPPVGTPTTA